MEKAAFQELSNEGTLWVTNSTNDGEVSDSQHVHSQTPESSS
jgi:hypothetical protein